MRLLTVIAVLLIGACSHSPSQVKVVDMGLSGSSVGTATVRNGDSLSEIAHRYQLSMQGIITANKLKPPYVIYPNQRLILPPPRTYKVKRGDTIYDISRLFSTTQNKIVRLNAIKKPYHIREGQVLKMPSPEQYWSDQPDEIPESIHKIRRKAKIAAPKMSGNGQFLKPVKGTVISSYGAKSGGLHNDGINIAAPLGTKVRSAQAGVVAYTGDAIEGYGRLILIRHDKGYMSAYAHLDHIHVKRGHVLSKGDVIGTVGQTGHVNKPQLHFEIRKGSKALNPSLYF